MGEFKVLRMYFEREGRGCHAAQPTDEFILAGTFIKLHDK